MLPAAGKKAWGVATGIGIPITPHAGGTCTSGAGAHDGPTSISGLSVMAVRGDTSGVLLLVEGAAVLPSDERGDEESKTYMP
mmetsp:Transcript_115839/g.201106  ORF Transcript_115839/g.201106 Transcript_115839/m.201106 type:complete len:82 (+) Transcript_115839:275-520(+)